MKPATSGRCRTPLNIGKQGPVAPESRPPGDTALKTTSDIPLAPPQPNPQRSVPRQSWTSGPLNTHSRWQWGRQPGSLVGTPLSRTQAPAPLNVRHSDHQTSVTYRMRCVKDAAPSCHSPSLPRPAGSIARARPVIPASYLTQSHHYPYPLSASLPSLTHVTSDTVTYRRITYSPAASQ